MSVRDGIDNAIGCLLVLLFFFVALPIIGLAGLLALEYYFQF